MIDLLRRRETIIAEHKAQEKYDPHWKAEAAAGAPISERPIAFVCDDEIVVVGPCVDKVRAGMSAFLDLVDADEKLSEKANQEPLFGQAVARCRRLLASKDAEIRLPSQWWNLVNRGLSQAGLTVVLAEGG